MASYQVLARKWRPQQFDDVVGQDHVTRTLQNAIRENRVAHAYLFVGPRGIGKTSSARIFAKALNCEKGPTPTPCDQCDMCREIMAGNSMDVLEIDGASNNGVEQVRDLRDNARYTPVKGHYKIYIIDEVHMLTQAAFNALLKTLEEPPAHVKFILATTEPQKVPATILSRCQRFDLRRIPTKGITQRLAEIAKAEGVDIDEDALLAIARGAEGGLRDAESSMDQLISFIGKQIREPDVLSVFGLVARQALEELAGAILKGDVSTIIRRIMELDESGKDMQRLTIELLEYFRNVLICIHAEEAAEALDITGSQRTVLIEQARATSPGRVLNIVQILTETEGRLRYALSQRTLLETALIRAARAATVVSIDEILAELKALKEAVAKHTSDTPSVEEPASSVPEAAPQTEKKKPVRPVTKKELPSERPESEPAEPELAEPEPAEPTPAEPAPDSVPVDYVTELGRIWMEWGDLCEQVSHTAPLARNYLRDAKPVWVEEGWVKLGFDPEFASSLESIDVPRNRRALQNVLSRFLHREVIVEFGLLSASDTLPGDIKLPPRESDDVKEEAPPISQGAQSVRQKWIENPAVLKVLEEFNGEIIEIRE